MNRHNSQSILNPTTYLITLPQVTRLKGYFWPLFGVVLLLAIFMTSSSSRDGLINELYLPAIVVGATVWMGITSNICLKKMERILRQIDQLCWNPEDCRARLKTYLDRVFSWEWHTAAGIVACLGMVALIYTRTNGFTSSHDWYDGKYSYYPFLIGWTITSFVIGAGFIIVVGTMMIPGKLAKEKVRLNLHSYKKSAIRDLSTTFIVLSVYIFGAAMFAVAGVVGSPHKSDIGLILMYFGYVWISFVYAIWTQWGIHEILIKGKLVILSTLRDKFDAGFDELQNGFGSESNMEDRLNRVLSFRREIVSFPDWTLNPANFGAIVIPSLSGTVALILKFKSEIAAFLGIGN